MNADIGSRTVDWWSVHLFVESKLSNALDSWPTAGTLPWIDLDDDDPLKVAAVLDGGQHWALHLDGRQEALAQASRDVSVGTDCTVLARSIRRRESGIYIAREVA